MAETETAVGSLRRKMSSHVTALAGPAGRAGGGGIEREPSGCPAVDKAGTCLTPGPRASILAGGEHAAGGCPPRPREPKAVRSRRLGSCCPEPLAGKTPHLTALLTLDERGC